MKTSIDIVQWLTFQGCPFRGHDETPESKNWGNFLEMIRILASYNDKVEQVVLEMLLNLLSTLRLQFRRRFCMLLQVKCEVRFVKILGIPNFVLLLMSQRESKWLLF